MYIKYNEFYHYATWDSALNGISWISETNKIQSGQTCSYSAWSGHFEKCIIGFKLEVQVGKFRICYSCILYTRPRKDNNDEKECKEIFKAKNQEKMDGKAELGTNEWEKRIIYKIRSRMNKMIKRSRINKIIRMNKKSRMNKMIIMNRRSRWIEEVG